MSYETLTLERAGAIATVWLDRPQKRNALNQLALDEIVAVCDELQCAVDTAVVVWAGRRPSFCAGADRTDPPGRTPAGSQSLRARRYAGQVGQRALEAIESLEAITGARIDPSV